MAVGFRRSSSLPAQPYPYMGTDPAISRPGDAHVPRQASAYGMHGRSASEESAESGKTKITTVMYRVFRALS